jgi:hypothetical protein
LHLDVVNGGNGTTNAEPLATSTFHIRHVSFASPGVQLTAFRWRQRWPDWYRWGNRRATAQE